MVSILQLGTLNYPAVNFHLHQNFFSFLDSLVFNDEVDAYNPWILFLIFASMVILISGVVLLTHKKPERSPRASAAPSLSGLSSRRAARSSCKVDRIEEDEDDEEQALRQTEEGEQEREDRAVLWQVGDDSEDEDDRAGREHTPKGVHTAGTTSRITEEGLRLMRDGEEADPEQRHEHSHSISSDTTLAQDPFHDDDDDFGQWK